MGTLFLVLQFINTATSGAADIPLNQADQAL